MSQDQHTNKSSPHQTSQIQAIKSQKEKTEAKKQDDQEVVTLKPIVKVLLGFLLIICCSVAFTNMVQSFRQMNHPKPIDHKSILTTASTLDTSWYSEEKIRPAKNNYSTAPITNPSGGSNAFHGNLSEFPLDEETQKAMAASISSNQITVDIGQEDLSKGTTHELTKGEDTDLVSSPIVSTKDESPNLENKKSPYILQAGTIIPGVLITGISSSLPGQVVAQVRSNVYDSLKFQYLLVPQGSKLIGSYDSKICFGQKRLFVIWQRIILPNGDSIHLGETPSSDIQGMSGFKDQVDNHYRTLLGSALLLSILSSGAQVVSAPSETTSKLTPATSLSQSVGLHIAETGSQLISKAMEIEPTISIRPGYLFNITVTKDIIFDQPNF